MLQILGLLPALTYILMIVCVVRNATAVRFMKAGGASFQEALKLVTATRWFWIQIICSALSLVGFVLIGLQKRSFSDSVLDSLIVVFIPAGVWAVMGFLSAPLLMNNKKPKEQ